VNAGGLNHVQHPAFFVGKFQVLQCSHFMAHSHCADCCTGFDGVVSGLGRAVNRRMPHWTLLAIRDNGDIVDELVLNLIEVDAVSVDTAARSLDVLAYVSCMPEPCANA
jgi:hypothetical protein